MIIDYFVFMLIETIKNVILLSLCMETSAFSFLRFPIFQLCEYGGGDVMVFMVLF